MTKLTDKILIYGNGHIGNFYLDYFNNETKHKAIISKENITDYSAVLAEIKKVKPTVVINTAAKTNLEWVMNNEVEAFNTNVLGANNVAKACSEMGIFYIFISSGCIFESLDENDLKTEESIPSPQAFYSWTKVWAEQIIPWKKRPDFKYLILRPRQPVASQISPKNMLVKLLTFTKFIDTPNTGTVIEDLMGWTKTLMEKRVTGIVNVANEGWSTPYRIGLLLKKHVLPELEVTKMTKTELDATTPVKRVDTILDVNRLKTLVGPENVKPYEERLEEIIIELGNNFRESDKKLVKTVMTETYNATLQRAKPNTVWTKLFE